jgi:hypothetical protein
VLSGSGGIAAGTAAEEADWSRLSDSKNPFDLRTIEKRICPCPCTFTSEGFDSEEEVEATAAFSPSSSSSSILALTAASPRGIFFFFGVRGLPLFALLLLPADVSTTDTTCVKAVGDSGGQEEGEAIEEGYAVEKG